MMPRWCSLVLALFLLLPATETARPAEPPAQADGRQDDGRFLRPLSRTELERRQAIALYGLGVLRQQNDRLLDATRLFEEALTYDPEALPVHRALITLYGALGRHQDMLKSCEKVLKLAPEDHATWHAYGRQLRALGKTPEARRALQHAVACPALASQLDLLVQVHYELAGLHEELRAPEEAVAALSAVCRVLDNPEKLREFDVMLDKSQVQEQAASTHERIIRLWIQADKPDRAIAAFQQAVATHPMLATRLNLQLAKLHVAEGQLAEALVRLDDHLRTQPVGAEGYELKATVLEKLGRAAEVLPMLEAYAGRDPHNLALHLLLGSRYGRAGQFERAEAFYQGLLAKQDTSPEVYRGLFALYRDHKTPEKALHALNLELTRSTQQDVVPGNPRAAARGRAMLLALRDDPDLGKALVPAALKQLDEGRPLHPDACMFLATLAARARQFPAAERLYRRCLEAELSTPAENAVYDGLLRVLWDARKYSDVVWLCERGLQKAVGANRLMFHLNCARALALLGKEHEGLAEADRAVSAALDDDTRFVARITRLRLLWHVDRPEQALGECQQLLKERLQPAQVRDVRHLLSAIYSSLRDFARSEEQLQLILKDDANDATACNDLGYIWADQSKNLAEAERLIRKAIDLDREQKKAGAGEPDKDNAAFLDSLGWVLFRRGDLDAARQWLEKAATLPGGEDDPVVWDHLGDVYSRMGDAGRAAAAWRRSLDLYDKDKRRKADDRSPQIKRKLQQLGTP
jgi:tetratricopeptide (TPR) repeat protein